MRGDISSYGRMIELCFHGGLSCHSVVGLWSAKSHGTDCLGTEFFYRGRYPRYGGTHRRRLAYRTMAFEFVSALRAPARILAAAVLRRCSAAQSKNRYTMAFRLHAVGVRMAVACGKISRIVVIHPSLLAVQGVSICPCAKQDELKSSQYSLRCPFDKVNRHVYPQVQGWVLSRRKYSLSMVAGHHNMPAHFSSSSFAPRCASVSARCFWENTRELDSPVGHMNIDGRQARR